MLNAVGVFGVSALTRLPTSQIMATPALVRAYRALIGVAALWRGKIYSGGWVDGGGGDAPVTEPATGAELGRAGIAAPADVARAAELAAAAQAGLGGHASYRRSALLRRAADPVAGQCGRHRVVGDQESGKIRTPWGSRPRRDAGDLRGRHAPLARLRRAAAQ